ncbi:hypothetical protein L2299_21975, partial [Gordonia hongkongensis]|nr:hypothetical protein [Gordonia hongkongensis]
MASGSSVLDLRGAGLAYDLAIDSHLELSGPMSARLWVSLPRGGDATLFVAVEKWAGTRWVPFVHGHEKVPTGGQVEVPAGGQIKVPTLCSSCRPGTEG